MIGAIVRPVAAFSVIAFARVLICFCTRKGNKQEGYSRENSLAVAADPFVIVRTYPSMIFELFARACYSQEPAFICVQR